VEKPFVKERPFRAAFRPRLPLVLNTGNPTKLQKQLSPRQPLLWAALSFAGGLWAGKYLWRPPSWWVIAALVFAASAACLLRQRALAPRALVLSAVFLTGALTIQVHGSGEPGQLFRYGQRIRFPATLVPPRNYHNPGAFDYASYLRDQGIMATASTKYDAIQILPGFSGSRVRLQLARVHRSVIAKVHALWPEHPAGLMDAVVIGRSRSLSGQIELTSDARRPITCWWFRG
jgi:hypothetical protein